MSYEDCAGIDEVAAVGVVEAAGVALGVLGLDAFTACQTSLVPLFTHLKLAVFVLATAPSFLQGALAFTPVVEAEKAIGAERIPIANTEVATNNASFFEVIHKTVPRSECYH